MSLDLFSSMDFYFTKFSFLNISTFLFCYSLFLLFFLKNQTFSRFYSQFKLMNSGLKLKFSWLHKLKPGVILFLMSLFYMIFLSKMLGLFPFAFGWTSHILMVFQFSLFVWMIMNLSKMSFNIINYFAHFTPQGVPLMLGFLLAKMELVSKLIRPLTLSLRLGINITTGHILLALISVMGVSSGITMIFLLLTFYFFFEIFVMIMQAMVYTLLVSQYYEE